MSAPHNHVVVAFDFTLSSYAALQQAVTTARESTDDLHVVCVVEPHHPLPGIPGEHVDYVYAERVEHAVADEVARHLAAVDRVGVHVCIHVRIGRPSDEILAVAADVGADVVIVGSRGQLGLRHLLAGSVAERVVREARCAVVVARPKAYETKELDDVVEVDPHHTYRPPHRYYYEDHRAGMRPVDWPLY